MANNKSGMTLAGIGAAAAAAAGAYWLYGAKDASKNRKVVKSWMLKARAEVMDAVEKAQDMDKEQYLKIVDSIVKSYAAIAGSQSKEIKQLVSDLKDSWRYIQAQRKPATSRAASMKSSTMKMTRKVLKKRR